MKHGNTDWTCCGLMGSVEAQRGKLIRNNSSGKGTVQWSAALTLLVCIVQKRGQEFQWELLFVMVMTLLDMAGWLHP